MAKAQKGFDLDPNSSPRSSFLLYILSLELLIQIHYMADDLNKKARRLIEGNFIRYWSLKEYYSSEGFLFWSQIPIPPIELKPLIIKHGIIY